MVIARDITELLTTGELSLAVVLCALAVAVALGTFHSLEPGHGKTGVAAYLMGWRAVQGDVATEQRATDQGSFSSQS